MNAEEFEWLALVQRIIDSDLLKRSSDRRRLLMFLWNNRAEEITATFVEREFYMRELGRRACPDRTRSAMGISELRKAVARYTARELNEVWQCVLPLMSESGTYGLSFSRAPQKAETASTRFWKPHLEHPEDTVVVTGAHLFFYNESTKVVLRLPFFSAKPNWDDEDIVHHAQSARKDLDLTGFTPWHNRYFAMGDIEAFEALAAFFHQNTGTLIKRKTVQSVDISEVRRRSSILFGRPQTNPYMERLLSDSPRAAKLGYRIHDQQGTVRIVGLREKEKKDLSAFPISPEGIVGPIIEGNKAFGIVSRFPNPGGKGTITIISCDYYSMLTGRLVQSLIDDKAALEIMDHAGWSSRPIPEAFEMLFTVDLFKGSRPDESFPTLVTWREV